MPFDPKRYTGQHSLDETQQIASGKQYYWVSGCGITLTNETATIESHADAGEVVRDGVTFDVPAVDLAHDAGDPDYPRWDTICNINDGGGLQIFKGTPEPVVTDSQGNELRGESAYTPSPSDSIPDTAIPLANVWIPAGASSNPDLTDQNAGGVAEPIVDRRITQASRANQETRRAVIESAGWYRIAQNGNPETASGGDRAGALFTIRDGESALHSTTTFYASVLFGNKPTLTLVNSASFGGLNGAITDLRLVSGGTSEGAALEVRVDPQSRTQVDAVERTIYQNKLTSGWDPINWEPGNVPSGFNTTTLNLDGSPMFAGARGNNHFNVSGDGIVTAEGFRQRDVGTKVYYDSNNIIPTGTEYRFEFNQVIRDPYNSYDPGQGRFTAPFTGVYAVKVTIGWLSDQGYADSPAQLRLFINSVDEGNIPIAQTFDSNFSDHTNVSTVLSTDLELVAGNQYEVKVLHKAGEDVSTNDGKDWNWASFRYIGGSNIGPNN